MVVLIAMAETEDLGVAEVYLPAPQHELVEPETPRL